MYQQIETKNGRWSDLAAYVQVPKDLTKVKTKVMFGLTLRQLVCFGLGGAVSIPVYFLSRGLLGTTMAAVLMILTALPFFLFAVYEKDGLPLEKILQAIYRQKIQRPGVRPYQTRNFYACIQEDIYEKEVLGLVMDEKKEGKRQNRKRETRDRQARSR